LVVDDEEYIRITIEATLEGYEILLAESALAAQEVLLSQEFDVVLCDLMMPGMTGLELFESLPADSPIRERFVFMTGGALPIAVESFLALATPRIISKPFTISKLREVVACVANERS
jgi:CheY-like chemotaxis protein